MNYRQLKLIIFVISIPLLLPSLSFSQGWGGYEQGAKAHGFGEAFTGLADDPSAIFFNPAGMVQLDGTQVSLGFAVPTIRGKFKSNGTSGIPGTNSGDETKLKDQYFFVPNAYITTKLNDKVFLGLGEYTVFGLGFKWPDSFEGKYAPSGKNAELKTITISPVIGYKINDKLSVAAGGRVERADMTIENELFTGITDVNSTVDGDDYGYGWNASLLYKFMDNYSFGLNYRSKVKHSFSGLDVDLSPEIPLAGLVSTKARLDIELPQFTSFGLAWSKDCWTVTFDGYWWDWSVLDKLAFKPDTPVAGQSLITTPMDWHDTWTWAIGTQYKMNVFERELSLRSGFMYEECPIPDNTVNPAGFQGDNLLYNIGAGAKVGPFYTDVFFTYVYTRSRDWNNPAGYYIPGNTSQQITGTFEHYDTFMFGCNLTYKF
ncbi:MAG: outer membrane protein transport protein [Desulfobacteraceae bacterium]